MIPREDRYDREPLLDFSTISICGGSVEISATPEAEHLAPLAIGDVVGGYRVIEELGRGGMGMVYRCADLQLGRDVAIKVLDSARRWQVESVARFVREAKVQAQTSHPSVVKLYHVFEWEGALAAVMELVSGPTVAQMLRDGVVMPERDAVRAVCQVLEGLGHMHSLGLIHRDVSTRNIIWSDRRNQFQLLDFGLAKAAEHSLELSLPGSVLGTPAFMSPEQARGSAVDVRSDLFSVGVVLYFLLVGEYPHREPTAVDMVAFLRGEESFSSQAMSCVNNRRLRMIVQQALQKSPLRRYQSAHDMLIELLGILGETSAIERRQSPSLDDWRDEQDDGGASGEDYADLDREGQVGDQNWVFLLLAVVILITVALIAFAMVS